MKNKNIIVGIIAATMFFAFGGCNAEKNPNQEMISLLSRVSASEYTPDNPFCTEAQLARYDSFLLHSNNYMETAAASFGKGLALLQQGDELQSISVFTNLLKTINPASMGQVQIIRQHLAIAYLRLGERTNCVRSHTGETCVFPIKGSGIHQDKTGSENAIEVLTSLLKSSPDDLESRWLLNIAYMTTGNYPQSVPSAYLIKGLGEDTLHLVKPFVDAAINTGLNRKNMAGGSIVEDLNNDGYLDILTSSWGLNEGMNYRSNNGNGSFTNASQTSGLAQLTGGLNMMQTDYNNDGLKDIFVLRGGWKARFGNEPNSLLRNNGDGTFTDVTKKSGLLSFHPTQTATWNDFNNDGWLDVFIGNETVPGTSPDHTCELYINNRNGTFTNTAVQSGANITRYVKGVTSGDYDNDGLPDIFISTMDAQKVLLKNMGSKDGVVRFKDVTTPAGLGGLNVGTFPTWFWDYDNDGWLDLFVCGYEFDKSLAHYAAAEALHLPMGKGGQQYLFRNNHNGTFEDVSEKSGLNKVAFAMGSNFGDIDNDGYPDIYLGTGNPMYQSLVPNKMFKNMEGKYFADITSAARVGNLQKGHGVAFADLDNDGDQDIFIEMGGAYAGDAYQNSLYINPGQNNNHWVNLSLEGTTCNKAAIGARVQVTFKENGVERSVYRDVNSGGSFGANPLLQHIGIGSATTIESITIKWPVSKTVQVFTNVAADQTLKIKEGSAVFTKASYKKCDFTSEQARAIRCSPM